MTSPADTSADAQALLDATPHADCPACNERLPLLLVPEWGTRPRLCQVDADGPMRLAAGVAHDTHAVVCFNGPKVPGSPTFVAHWARCTANGLFAESLAHATVLVLDDPASPHGRPVQVRHVDGRDSPDATVLVRCLLTGRSLRLPGDGRATGRRVDTKRVGELLGLSADARDVEALHPLAAAGRAASDAGVVGPDNTANRPLLAAGLLDDETAALTARRNPGEPEYWWLRIGVSAGDLQDDTIPSWPPWGMPRPVVDVADPAAALLVLWLHCARDHDRTGPRGGRTAAQRELLDALGDDEWFAAAAVDERVRRAIGAAYDNAELEGAARLAAWRSDGPHSRGARAADDGGAQQLALI